MKIFLFFFSLLMLLTGCNDLATFDKPQPPDSKPLATFPKRLRGSYWGTDHLSHLFITSGTIIKTYDFKGLIKQLDSTEFELHQDTLLNKKTNERLKITLSGDSLSIHFPGIDTLFSISQTNILKRDKGYYFLNSKIGSNEWSVHILSIEKGLLTIGYIKDSSEIKLLKELSENTEDSTGYHFSPTQRQFESFVKQNGFRDRDTFYRISEH